MTIQADNTGAINGYFDIPEGIPVGTKKVEFIGVGGSYGEATFTGNGTITLEQRRRVTQIITQRFDPLAQTFTLDAAAHIAACKVRFTKKGSKQVRVQIRTTQNGFPTQTVLAQGFLDAANIALSGMTQIDFNPAFLEADQEYCLVLLTDDAEHSLAIAEIGKYSTASTSWITAQPYQIGVLLSSSNASTWTAHQDKDLNFELLACEFDSTTVEISAGFFDVVDITDALVLATVERTDSATEVEWLIRQTDKTDIRLQAGQSIILPEAITGNIELVAKLKGTANRSPIIYSGVQIVFGTLKTSAEYISRAIICGNNTQTTIRLDEQTTGQSAVNVWMEVDGKWQIATPNTAQPIGDGWEQRSYKDVINTTNTRLKLTLEGSSNDRPTVKNLSMVTTDA